jgi:hypothetical protein
VAIEGADANAGIVGDGCYWDFRAVAPDSGCRRGQDARAVGFRVTAQGLPFVDVGRLSGPHRLSLYRG